MLICCQATHVLALLLSNPLRVQLSSKAGHESPCGSLGLHLVLALALCKPQLREVPNPSTCAFPRSSDAAERGHRVARRPHWCVSSVQPVVSLRVSARPALPRTPERHMLHPLIDHTSFAVAFLLEALGPVHHCGWRLFSGDCFTEVGYV